VQIADDTDAIALARFIGMVASTADWYLSVM